MALSTCRRCCRRTQRLEYINTVAPIPYLRLRTARTSSKVLSPIHWNSATYRCRSVNLSWLPRNESDSGRIELVTQTSEQNVYDRVLTTSHRLARLRGCGSRQKWIAALNHPVDENWKSGSKLSPSSIDRPRRSSAPGREGRRRLRRRRRRRDGWLNLENVIAFVQATFCAQTAYKTGSLVSSRRSPSTYPQLVDSPVSRTARRDWDWTPSASRLQMSRKRRLWTTSACMPHLQSLRTLTVWCPVICASATPAAEAALYSIHMYLCHPVFLTRYPRGWLRRFCERFGSSCL